MSSEKQQITAIFVITLIILFFVFASMFGGEGIWLWATLAMLVFAALKMQE